jgi:hypothetical protein
LLNCKCIFKVFENSSLTNHSPLLFGWAAQFYGIGVVGPVYFFLHYLSAKIENFKALDMRLTNMAYTRTVLPVMVVAYYIPHYVSYLAPEFPTRHSGAWIWQLFPIWVSVLHIFLKKTVMPDTIQQDRIHAPLRDLSTIRFAVGTFVALAGAVWIYTLVKSPYSLITVFIPHLYDPTSWTSCVRVILQCDHLFCWGSAILWLGYLFGDLKQAGMITQSWAKIFTFTALTLVAFGPGVTVGLGWLWREDILATKKHKSAVVKVYGAGSVMAERHKNVVG